MIVDREYIKKQFDEYVSGYDPKNVKIRLKQEHTCYVAQNCERIAVSLGLSKADTDLAWVLGMFHDIGRFEQLRRYDTFRDSVSVNHAVLSADLLFSEGMVSRFLKEYEQEAQLMERAVRFHNLYRLPEELTERERMFSDILRDADKIDIFRVNCEIPRTEIYDLPEEEFLCSEMTDEVFEEMISHEEVNRKFSRTGIDFIMGHIGFVYGLVFPESRKIAKEQGYLKQLLAFESRNPRTQERIRQVRKAVKEYMDS